MSNVVQLKQSDKSAIKAVKSRFIRIPSNTTYPRFKDLVTEIEQADPGILVHCYRSNGGTEHNAAYLLECLDWCYGESFLPNGPALLTGGLANLWKAPTLQPTGAEVAHTEIRPFLEFLERWFPDEAERSYFMWWMAHTIRRPEQRIIATPVLRSDHGTGKGFFAETLMATLLGKQSAAVCALKDVVGDFNDVIEGKTFLLIDEVYKSKKSTTDHLKSIQGNMTVALRRKHKPVVTIDNFINFVVTSNDHIPLVLEKGDRRFWVPAFIKHKDSTAETENFINKVLKPWLEGDGLQLVRDWLEGIDLSLHSPTSAPPMTEAKQELMGFTVADKLDDLLAEYLEASQVVTVQSIKRSLEQDVDDTLSDMQVASALMAAGCLMKRANTTRYYITKLGVEQGLGLHSKPRELEQYISSTLPPSNS